MKVISSLEVEVGDCTRVFVSDRVFDLSSNTEIVTVRGVEGLELVDGEM